MCQDGVDVVGGVGWGFGQRLKDVTNTRTSEFDLMTQPLLYLTNFPRFTKTKFHFAQSSPFLDHRLTNHESTLQTSFKIFMMTYENKLQQNKYIHKFTFMYSNRINFSWWGLPWYRGIGRLGYLICMVGLDTNQLLHNMLRNFKDTPKELDRCCCHLTMQFQHGSKNIQNLLRK